MRNLIKNINYSVNKSFQLFSKSLGIKIAAIMALFLIGFFLAKSDNSQVQLFKRTKILMGTVVEVQVRDKNVDRADLAISKAFDEIKRIDELFSTHYKESPVKKINDELNSSVTLNEELFKLILFSDSIVKISENAFDISLGNLIDLWGFSSGKQNVPNHENLNAALINSGWTNIKLETSSKVIFKNQVKFDFGAIAKGYAVDKAIEILKNNNIEAALVNAGGEIKGYGFNWIVGIQHPRNRNELVEKIIINEMSAATSGDYEQFFEQDGKRYHHILNPKTGMPANGCQSVTVVCKENKTADALATAVFVLGKEKGMKLIGSLKDVEGMIIDLHGNIFKSKGFTKFLLRS